MTPSRPVLASMKYGQIPVTQWMIVWSGMKPRSVEILSGTTEENAHVLFVYLIVSEI